MIKKFICINNKINFTVGKIYDVKTIKIKEFDVYIIYQNHLLPIQLDKEWFDTIFISLSEWRNQQIDKILKD